MQKILLARENIFQTKSKEWKYLHFCLETYRLEKSTISNTVCFGKKCPIISSFQVFFHTSEIRLSFKKSGKSYLLSGHFLFLWLSLLSSCHNWEPNRFSTTTTIFLAYVVCRHLNDAHSGRFEEGKKTLEKCISSHELVIMSEFCGVNPNSNFGVLKKGNPSHAWKVTIICWTSKANS